MMLHAWALALPFSPPRNPVQIVSPDPFKELLEDSVPSNLLVSATRAKNSLVDQRYPELALADPQEEFYVSDFMVAGMLPSAIIDGHVHFLVCKRTQTRYSVGCGKSVRAKQKCRRADQDCHILHETSGPDHALRASGVARGARRSQNPVHGGAEDTGKQSHASKRLRVNTAEARHPGQSCPLQKTELRATDRKQLKMYPSKGSCLSFIIGQKMDGEVDSMVCAARALANETMYGLSMTAIDQNCTELEVDNYYAIEVSNRLRVGGGSHFVAYLSGRYVIDTWHPSVGTTTNLTEDQKSITQTTREIQPQCVCYTTRVPAVPPAILQARLNMYSKLPKHKRQALSSKFSCQPMSTAFFWISASTFLAAGPSTTDSGTNGTAIGMIWAAEGKGTARLQRTNNGGMKLMYELPDGRQVVLKVDSMLARLIASSSFLEHIEKLEKFEVSGGVHDNCSNRNTPEIVGTKDELAARPSEVLPFRSVFSDDQISLLYDQGVKAADRNVPLFVVE